MTTITQDSTAQQAPAKKKSSRILAVDILRGITPTKPTHPTGHYVR